VASTARDHDVVLLGASGFVGRLTAAHLATHAAAGVRIALAGRSRDRLLAVRARLGGRARTWPLLVVDVLDADAVTELAETSRVIATTVGPYARFGHAVVAACAETGTHYADLTGELLFVRRSIDANHRAAQRTRARIVHGCGFEAIPADLGVWLTAMTARRDGAGELTDTVLHVRELAGGISGGSLESARRQAIEVAGDEQARRLLADPYALSPARAEEPDAGAPPWPRPAPTPGPEVGPLRRLEQYGRLRQVELAVRTLPVRRPDASGLYSVPSPTSVFDGALVRRSNALTGWDYGRGLRFSAVVDTGTGALGIMRAGGVSLARVGIEHGLRHAATWDLVRRVLPSLGQGPSGNTLRRGRFVIEIEARTTSGARYLTRIAARLDPGYSGTAVMFGESALALALDDLPDRAGVLTPATALGEALITRLRARGFTVSCRRVGRPSAR